MLNPRSIIDPFTRMLGNDEGATLAEYAIITAMVAIGCIVGLKTFAGNFNSFFAKHVDKF